MNCLPLARVVHDLVVEGKHASCQVTGVGLWDLAARGGGRRKGEGGGGGGYMRRLGCAAAAAAAGNIERKRKG